MFRYFFRICLEGTKRMFPDKFHVVSVRYYSVAYRMLKFKYSKTFLFKIADIGLILGRCCEHYLVFRSSHAFRLVNKLKRNYVGKQERGLSSPENPIFIIPEPFVININIFTLSMTMGDLVRISEKFSIEKININKSK